MFIGAKTKDCVGLATPTAYHVLSACAHARGQKV